MRKLPAAIAATGLAAALVACSSADNSADNHTTPASSGLTSQQSGGGGSGASIDSAAFIAQATDAAKQAQTAKFKSTATLFGDPVTSTGAERFGDTGTDATVTTTSPSFGAIDLIVVDDVVYTKGIEDGQPGKPWVKDTEASKEIAKQVDEIDPRKILPLLSSVGTLKPAGQESVNGVATTHYSVPIDLSKVAKLARQDLQTVEQAFAAGVRQIDLQVWVDAQKRLSRLTMSLEAQNPAKKTEKIKLSQTVDYTDWGAPVTIQAPPADQVAEQ